MTDLIDIDIPSEFIDLCRDWAGGTNCMLRAIDSTGGLTLGTRRPYSDDVSRYLTDHEWHVSLWSSLSCNIRGIIRMIEKGSNDPESLSDLRSFEEFADETEDFLRKSYGLTNSEAV